MTSVIRYKASSVSPPMKVIFVVVFGPPLILIPLMASLGKLKESLDDDYWLIWGVSMIVSVVLRSRVQLVVDRAQQTVSVRQGARQTQTFTTAPAVWVDVQAAQGSPRYRLVLVARDGTWQALTEAYYYGRDHHQAVAEQLRQALGFPSGNRPGG